MNDAAEADEEAEATEEDDPAAEVEGATPAVVRNFILSFLCFFFSFSISRSISTNFSFTGFESCSVARVSAFSVIVKIRT
jgi:hypothetical protein